MPLYRGTSVKDALGKALRTRDKLKIGQPHTKPKQLRRTTSADLQDLRREAIAGARAYLANSNYNAGSPEDGYAEVFLIDLQQVVKLPGSQCGHPVTGADGTPKWRYDFSRFRAHPFYVLVFGYSHPNISRNPSAEERRMLCRPSTPRPGNPNSDRDLFPYAPVVIGCANGSRPWNTNRTYRQWDR